MSPRFLAILSLLPAFLPHVAAGPSLIFSDNMVLQRDRTIPVWGTAKPGEKVIVSFAGQTASDVADEQGHWIAELPPLATGGPYELTISDSSGSVVFKNILLGDVWFCAGQSNMAFPLKSALNADLEIASSGSLKIRFFNISPRASLEPQRSFDPRSHTQGWQTLSPQSAGDVSAVAYYFAKTVQTQTDVPIGLVTAAWGGTPLEAWTPLEELRELPWMVKGLAAREKAAEALQADPSLSITASPITLQGKPGVLADGMVKPLVPFALRGVLWYQGEQNAGAGREAYTEIFRRLIASWRRDFRDANLPVFFVQLPNYNDRYEGTWPRTREALLYALQIPNTGMAIAIDQGEGHDIHPRGKEEVGKRLARLALAKSYKHSIEFSGPIYRSMETEGSVVRLEFAAVGTGLMSKDGAELREFEIAAADAKFQPAKAAIDKDGKTVLVWRDDIPAPRAVRYAWRNNPSVNLFNKAGLPASPFRTDAWPEAERSEWSVPASLLP